MSRNQFTQLVASANYKFHDDGDLNFNQVYIPQVFGWDWLSV